MRPSLFPQPFMLCGGQRGVAVSGVTTLGPCVGGDEHPKEKTVAGTCRGQVPARRPHLHDV